MAYGGNSIRHLCFRPMQQDANYGLFAHLLLKAMQRQDGQRMSDQIVEKLRAWDESFQYHEAKMKKLDSAFPESVLEFLLTQWVKQMAAKGYIPTHSNGYMFMYAPKLALVVEEKDRDILEMVGFKFATKPKKIDGDTQPHAQWWMIREDYTPPPRDRKRAEISERYRKLKEQKT